MKGVIFTEFFELVEQTWGLDMVDELIASCDLESGGAYTAVGTYDHAEIVALVQELSRRSGVSVSDLLKTYGTFLFGRFVTLYPAFFEVPTSALDFLESVETYIHTEVRKLYPDAKLPSFDTHRHDENTLTMLYQSERHLQDVAHGLILGCFQHFGEEGEVEMKEPGEDGPVRFTVMRRTCLTTV